MDETEHMLRVDGDIGTHNVMMLHARLLRRWFSGQVTRHDIMIPPALLSDQGAETLAAAIERRAGPFLVSGGNARSVTVLGSDSAKALVKLAGNRGQAATSDHMSVHSRCMMHMIFSAFVYTISDLQVINDMFCATTLTHKGLVMKELRTSVRKYIEEHIEIDFTRPDPDVVRQNRAIVSLLNGLDAEASEDCEVGDFDRVSKVSERRLQARTRLLNICGGDWSKRGKVVHTCNFWCNCSSRADAAALVYQTLLEAVLDTRPPIPALSRWGKVYAPLAWWYFSLAFHGVVADCFVQLLLSDLQREKKELQAMVERFQQQAGLGPRNEQDHRRERLGRMSRARNFLACEQTLARLVAGACTMKPGLALLRYFFASARLATPTSVIPLCHTPSSPIVRNLQSIFRLLRDPDSDHWLPVLAVHNLAWGDVSMHTVATLHMRFMGHAFLRCVQPFCEWPWILARLVHPSVEGAERLDIARAFVRLRPCCVTPTDGMTLQAKDLYPTVDLVLGADAGMFLRDVFMMCPPTNVAIEDRFARSRRHTHPNEAPATMASQHSLSEWSSMATTLRAQ